MEKRSVWPVLIPTQTPTFTCSGNNIQITGHALANNAVVVIQHRRRALCAIGSRKRVVRQHIDFESVEHRQRFGNQRRSHDHAQFFFWPDWNVSNFVRNINSTNQTTGLSICDGYYPSASISGATIMFTAAGCPTGAAASGSLEVWINPYFVNYVNGNAVTVSATPGGSVVSLTNTGSGTNTLTQRMRFPYWTDSGFGNGGNGRGVAGRSVSCLRR